jgi:hypothetical protein
MADVLKKILLGKQYLGIEFFSLANEEKIATLQVERKKDQLTIAAEQMHHSREDLLKEKSKLSAVLVINTSQVLQKEVQGTDPNDKKLLHKAFPNLQLNDFYFEIWRNDMTSCITICRKGYVEELLEALKPYFKIFSVSLGISSISGLKTFTNANTLSTNTQTVDLNDPEHIVSNGVLAGGMDINGLKITNTHLLGFSAALGLVVQFATTGSIQELNERLAEAYRQDSFFDRGLKIGIGLLLSILLINFFFFSHYFDKAREGEEAVSLNKAGIEKMVKIRERIKNKELALGGLTGNAGSKSSLLINQMVKDMPTTLLLTKIDYHPLDKKIKKDEAVLTLNDQISISGTTISNNDFTGWIENIEKIDDIKNVTIANFGKDSEDNTVFTLKITVNETK